MKSSESSNNQVDKRRHSQQKRFASKTWIHGGRTKSINIIHNIALGEVDKNLEAMSDEEKKAALEELVDKTQADNSQKTKGQVAK